MAWGSSPRVLTLVAGGALPAAVRVLMELNNQLGAAEPGSPLEKQGLGRRWALVALALRTLRDV